jgi:hypothetical protein
MSPSLTVILGRALDERDRTGSGIAQHLSQEGVLHGPLREDSGISLHPLCRRYITKDLARVHLEGRHAERDLEAAGVPGDSPGPGSAETTQLQRRMQRYGSGFASAAPHHTAPFAATILAAMTMPFNATASSGMKAT